MDRIADTTERTYVVGNQNVLQVGRTFWHQSKLKLRDQLKNKWVRQQSATD